MKKKSKLERVIDLIDKNIWELALINGNLTYLIDNLFDKNQDERAEEQMKMFLEELRRNKKNEEDSN